MIERWNNLIGLLQLQRDSAPEPTVAATRTRVKALYAEASSKMLPLPAPGYEDPIFEDMVFGGGVVEAAKELISDEKKLEAQRAEWRRVQLIRRKQAAAALGHEYKHRFDRGKNLCYCGCGRRTRSYYAGGHQSRWYHWIRHIEMGYMNREQLPKLLRENLRWCRCRGCSGWIPNTDSRGRPLLIHFGPECARRRMKLERAGHLTSKAYIRLRKAEKGEL